RLHLVALLGLCGRSSELGDEHTDFIRRSVEERHDVALRVQTVGWTKQLGLERTERRILGADREAESERLVGFDARKTVDVLDPNRTDSENAHERRAGPRGCGCGGEGR